MLLGQKLATTVNTNATKSAFRYLGKNTNFKDAYSYINRYSYFLQNEIQHNKKVLVYMSNCPHMAYTFFALANTKNLAVFVDPATPDPKVIDKIRDLELQYVIVSDDYVHRMKDLLKNNGLGHLPVIQCEQRRWGEYDETYRLPTSMSSKDTDVVALFETSGTGGKPKLVPWTHTMIQQACLALKGVYRGSSIDQFFSYQSSLAHPFYFIHGLIFPMMSGFGVVISDFSQPEELVKELMEAKATRLITRGLGVEEWLRSLLAMNLRWPLLRSITPEYAPLSPSFQELCKTELNECRILEVYGSVETCWAIAARQFEEPEPFGTQGKFLPGLKTRIIDDNGDDVPEKAPRRGQLLVSGPNVATSYFDNKEATKLQFRGQWFFTGDYVEVDKAGVVQVLDRKDNICRVITHFVAPRLVEQKLARCPGVEHIALINTKDGLGKAVLTAVIVKKAGIELSVSDFQAYCVSNLEEFERPKSIAFLPEMPFDTHGIINRYRLRFDFGA